MTTRVVALHHDPSAQSRWTSPLAIIWYCALVKLLLHFLTSGQYGYFRDEFYFIARGEHLDWGYVDQAPLAPWLARLNRTLLGDSLFALRFLPAVAGATKVLLTGLMVRELGGGRFAVLFACLCVLVSPVYLVADMKFSKDAFEPVFWMGCAYCVMRVINRNEPWCWLWFGLCAGLGLENKHSMLFFGFGIFVGLLLGSAEVYRRNHDRVGVGSRHRHGALHQCGRSRGGEPSVCDGH